MILGGLTAGLAVDTGNLHSKFTKNNCGQVNTDDCSDIAKKGRNEETGMYVLGGTAAGVGIATAIVALAFTRWSGSKEATPRVSAGVTPHGASASLALDF